jgi:hypothetical protein
MSLLEYLMDAPYECGPNDANVAAFTEVVVIIGGRDAVEEFIACSRSTEGSEFKVKRPELPILKVVVPMRNVTVIMGQ